MAPTSSQARMGAHKSWAQTADRSARTAPARAARQARFEQQVDPEARLSPEERAIRADHARRAFYTALSIKAAAARRAKSLGTAGVPSGTERPSRLGGPRGNLEVAS